MQQALQAAKFDQGAIIKLISVATEEELQLRRTCVRVPAFSCAILRFLYCKQGSLLLLQILTAFRQVDEHGQPIKRSPEEVAGILQLPVLR